MRRISTIVLVPYVIWLVFCYEYHFLDGVNLLLHEAGHVVFGLLGSTMHFLGGTLGQLFFPVAFAIRFLRRHERFEAAVCTVWVAESLMYTAEYLADARALRLPLVGGHIHDWNWLLARWGLLGQCETIGTLLHFAASLLALGGLAVCLREAGWLAKLSSLVEKSAR